MSDDFMLIFKMAALVITFKVVALVENKHLNAYVDKLLKERDILKEEVRRLTNNDKNI